LRTDGRSDLETSLNAYSAAVQTETEPRTWNARLGSWSIYAAATGSALALGTSAGASIIHGFSNLTVTAPGTMNVQYGTLTIGQPPAVPYQYPYILALNPIFPGFQFGLAFVSDSCACGLDFFVDPFDATMSMNPLHRFASGDVISGGGAPSFYQSGFLAARCQGVASFACNGTASFDKQPWGPSNVYGFAGFRTAGTGTGSNFIQRFGWIRLKWNSNAGFPNSITALDWAIEDSGAPIVAGATGTPEPGTMSMALLAAGAAGIVAWRKRRAVAKG
jgi:hypothetical protein